MSANILSNIILCLSFEDDILFRELKSTCWQLVIDYLSGKVSASRFIKLHDREKIITIARARFRIHCISINKYKYK